ncbi:SGNH/GDSL hydrolase family protein [Nonomuraea sp. NPDC050310]|uniref:SGNH/GDSL hydrolase family protein n=1 Tax=unclassified Nonomuraea TaxID=2593643 RepID=UPI0033DA3A54
MRAPAGESRAPVMMAVGDSFTVGSGPVPAWQSYAAAAARTLRWQPVIAGAGGTGFVSRGRVGRNFRESFEAELAWRPAPDVLIISGGHNDRRWSTQHVRRAASSLLWLARAQWPRTRIVVIGPIWLDTPPPGASRVRDALAEVAGREGVTFLDAMAQRWITGDPAAVMLPDGVHPTRGGHARIAAWLVDSLAKAGFTAPA